MSRARAAIAAVVLLLAASCGKKEGPPAVAVANPERTTCSMDADCAITTFAGCCACCPGEPRALPKEKVEAEQGKCAATSCLRCPENADCAATQPESAFVARCERGTCVRAQR